MLKIFFKAIYWITGINLSTFSFSRSDDPDASGLVTLHLNDYDYEDRDDEDCNDDHDHGNIFFTTFKVGLANTVDNALMEFNIDGKGCIAKSM